MLKNIQFKIMFVFLIIGILLIGGFGVYYINSMNAINTQITSHQISETGQVINQINSLTKDIKIILIIFLKKL